MEDISSKNGLSCSFGVEEVKSLFGGGSSWLQRPSQLVLPRPRAYKGYKGTVNSFLHLYRGVDVEAARAMLRYCM